MISFCTVFYPWYRNYDRTEEIFDVLINSLNQMKGVRETELSIVNAGVLDVWNWDLRFKRPTSHRREFNSYKFKERICKSFKGKVKYLLDEDSINWDEYGVPRFWVAKGLQTSVNISTNEYLLITGIDCYFSENFIEEYFSKVNDNQAWVILSTACKKVEDIKNYFESNQNEIIRRHYTAKGIIGITKSNFYKLGGFNINRIKDKVDSDFYRSLKRSDINVREEPVNSVYHVWHPGSHMS
jgi:hypothetical protein